MEEPWKEVEFRGFFPFGKLFIFFFVCAQASYEMKAEHPQVAAGEGGRGGGAAAGPVGSPLPGALRGQAPPASPGGSPSASLSTHLSLCLPLRECLAPGASPPSHLSHLSARPCASFPETPCPSSSRGVPWCLAPSGGSTEQVALVLLGAEAWSSRGGPGTGPRWPRPPCRGRPVCQGSLFMVPLLCAS